MKQHVFFRASVIIAIVLITFAGIVNAQQTKRNLVANSNFEDGLKHWRWDGNSEEINFSEEDMSPVSGSKSARIEVLKNTENPWQLQFYYFFPVEEYAKYKISFKVRSAMDNASFKVEVCESYENQTGFKPLDLESWQEGFQPDNQEANDLRGVLTAGTAAREYSFITTGSQFGYPNYILAFMFGNASLTTFWIDDIKISRVDEGDWDGNLFPVGNFESDRIVIANNQGYYIDGRTNDPLSVAYIDTQNPISGNKSFYIYKSPNENFSGYWELSYHFQFWRNDVSRLDISFQAKSSADTKLPVRMICHPWGHGGGDVFQWEIPLTTTLQSIRPDQYTAVGWLGKNSGAEYASVMIPAYEWTEGAWDGHRGRMSLHGSLLDNNVSKPGVGIWIDNVVIRESSLFLDKFDVTYAPSTVAVNETAQFTIGEIVYPTHAPSQVEFWVDNRTGIAEIDQNGSIRGIKVGLVDVYIDTPNMTDEKKFTVEVTEKSGLGDLNLSVIQLSSTLVNSGELIEIKSQQPVDYVLFDVSGKQLDAAIYTRYIHTSVLDSGVYLVVVTLEDGQRITRKFIVK